MPRNLVLLFRVLRTPYACNDIADAQLFLISFYSGDEPKETSVKGEKPEADPEEKDDEDGNAFWVPGKIKLTGYMNCHVQEIRKNPEMESSSGS